MVGSTAPWIFRHWFKFQNPRVCEWFSGSSTANISIFETRHDKRVIKINLGIQTTRTKI